VGYGLWRLVRVVLNPFQAAGQENSGPHAGRERSWWADICWTEAKVVGSYILTAMYQTINTASVKTTTPVQNKPLSASSLIASSFGFS
jgi:hypothetical protein